MEMEFNDGSRRRRRLLMVLGIVLAVVAGAIAFSAGNQPPETGPAPEVPRRDIVVAAVDIASQTVIDASMLTIRSVPDDPAFATALGDGAGLIGRKTAVAVAQGQPLTLGLLAQPSTGTFSILAPDETIAPDSPPWRAMSMIVPKERALGGLLVDGQHVDILATLPIKILVEDDQGNLVDKPTKEGYYSDKSTKVTLSDVQILRVLPDYDIYILKLDLDEAEELTSMLAVDGAQFTLSLRPDDDLRPIDWNLYGTTLNGILAKYLFPLPQTIQVDRFPVPLPEVLPTPTPAPLTPLPTATPSL